MTDVVELTLDVVTVKPAAVVPEPTVTLAGTLRTPGLLLDNETVAPPVGAPSDSDTNAEVLFPPVTLDGLTVTLCNVGPAEAGVTVRIAERVSPLYDAVIVTEVLAATADVVIVNDPVNPFCATVVVAGTLATAGLLLDSEMTAPSVADVSITTVPDDALPPTTDDGLTSIVDSREGGGAVWGVKLRTADQGPATPAELTPRTRQK